MIMENKRLSKIFSLIYVHLRRTISNGVRRSQTIVELALAFIIIAMLFIGGFKIWAGMENAFIKETTDYQGQRLDAGQGTVVIPGEDPIEAVVPEVEDEALQMAIDLQLCECIDDDTREEAVYLYTQQYELGVMMDAYTETIAGLDDSLDGLQEAYDSIPWCNSCCECKIVCPKWICTEWKDDDCIEGYWEYPIYWRTCQGSLDKPCLSADECSSSSYCGGLYCPEDDSSEDPSRECVDRRPNDGHDHNEWREQIQDSIDSTQEERDAAEDTYDGYSEEKTAIDSQVEDIQPQIACCDL